MSKQDIQKVIDDLLNRTFTNKDGITIKTVLEKDVNFLLFFDNILELVDFIAKIC